MANAMVDDFATILEMSLANEIEHGTLVASLCLLLQCQRHFENRTLIQFSSFYMTLRFMDASFMKVIMPIQPILIFHFCKLIFEIVGRKNHRSWNFSHGRSRR